ncbi:hypothetical protein ACXZ1M_24350 [Duganella sp. PWIR1]
MNKNYEIIKAAGYRAKKEYHWVIFCRCKTHRCTENYGGCSGLHKYRFAHTKSIEALAENSKPGSKLDKIMEEAIDETDDIFSLKLHQQAKLAAQKEAMEIFESLTPDVLLVKIAELDEAILTLQEALDISAALPAPPLQQAPRKSSKRL